MEKQFKFPHAVTAVDVVLFTVSEGKLQVLLLKLKEEPFVGKWALPGGLVSDNENLESAVKRHLETKVGIKSDIYFEQLYTFGEPNRDPRGWVVSVAYVALIPESNIKFKTTERYADISWHDIKNLPQLAYDHSDIIAKAVERIKAKVAYTNIVYALMPKEFTLTSLQKMYETILDKKLDKRNFRKKILSLKILTNLNKKTNTSNRPAELYKFADYKLIEAEFI